MVSKLGAKSDPLQYGKVIVSAMTLLFYLPIRGGGRGVVNAKRVRNNLIIIERGWLYEYQL